MKDEEPLDDVARFFSLARDPDATLQPDDKMTDLLKRIASDGRMTVRFRKNLADGNDHERREMIREVIARAAANLDAESVNGDSWAELLDRYVAPAAGSSVVAGIVAMIAGTTAAPLLFGAGVAGLAFAGGYRFWVKSTANSDKKAAKMIVRLLEKM